MMDVTSAPAGRVDAAHARYRLATLASLIVLGFKPYEFGAGPRRNPP